MSGAIRIRVSRAAGSTPREVGAEIIVGPDDTRGTIGGGALEWEAIHIARQMLVEGRVALAQTFPLGPALGQCCGGSVTLDFALAEAETEVPRQPLWVFGAGHVGRAIVNVMAPLPDWDVTWVDFDQSRFPQTEVQTVIAKDPSDLVAYAPDFADFLIVTHSHQLDLALCDRLLQRKTASIGLIGSATKWARFRKRLMDMGHASEDLARIACPIGDPSLGKHPAEIAIGVAAALMRGTARQKRERRA